MQRNFRLSAGVDRGLTRMVRINATYAHTSGDNLMRGLNLNLPVNGVRPDPDFANIVQVLGDAESRAHTLNIGASINFNVPRAGAPGGGGPGGPIMLGGGGREGMVMIMGAPPPPPRSRRRIQPGERTLELAPHEHFREHVLRPPVEQHRRRVQHAGHWTHRGRLGPGELRRAPPLQRELEQPAAQELQHQPEPELVRPDAVYHPHRFRHERRPRVHGPSRRTSAATPRAPPPSGR